MSAHRKEYEEGTIRMYRSPDREFFWPWNEEFRVQGTFGISEGNHKKPDDYTEVRMPFTLLFSTFEEYLREEVGYDEDDPETHFLKDSS